MKAIYLFLFSTFICFLANAQTYEAAAIPKDLLPYASAVIRNAESTVEVKDLTDVVYHIKEVITILNKNGDDDAHVAIFYQKGTTSIKNIKGAIYDEFGKQTAKIASKEFIDQSAVSSISLFEDFRVKHYMPHEINYPYTVAYEYDIESEQSLYFGDWRPNPSASTSIEKATYTFSCKPDFVIRYKELNMPTQVTIGTDKAGLKTYTWQVSNLKVRKPEPFSPNRDNYLACVKIAPEKFEYNGIKGSFTNWKDLGKWTYDKLLYNRQYLPDETVNTVKQLTAGITDPKLKAKKIYEYMQDKTHYISIQIGIGGYQPFRAEEVNSLGYGDCKGLVNYTQALLKQAGIESYYCVVTSGARKVSMMPDFASMNQGDHIILCLPFKNDTTWLECTNQKIPFGYLGNFTDDRWVLACTAEGGKLMHTPKYDANTNVISRKGDLIIDGKGELTANVTSRFTGILYENRGDTKELSPTEKNRTVQRLYNINNLQVKEFSVEQEKKELPVATEKLSFSAANFANEENGKLSIAINPIDRIGVPTKSVRDRQADVYLNEGFTYEDEFTITPPSGYRLPLIPLKVTINKPFGSYSATTAVKDGKIIYMRKLQVIDGTYNKDLYPELEDFYEKANAADRRTFLLTKENAN